MKDNFDKALKQLFVVLILTTKAIGIHAQEWTKIRHSNIFTLTKPDKILKKQFSVNFFIFKKATRAIIVLPTAAKEISKLFERFPSLFDSLFENSPIKIEKDDLAIFEIDFSPLKIGKVISIQNIEITTVDHKIIWRLTLHGHTNPCFENIEFSSDKFIVRNEGCEI